MELSEGGKRDNCNSIINKYILKKKKYKSVITDVTTNGDVKYSIGNIVNNILITIYGVTWVLDLQR